MFFKISVLKNYANSTGKNLSPSPFLIQLQALRPSFITEHLQWLLQTVSGFQPSTLLKKSLRQRCFYEDLLMNTFCVYLSILRNFWKTFEEFSKTFLCRFSWKLLLSWTSCTISTSIHSKKLFHRILFHTISFQVFCIRTRSSHWRRPFT